MMIIVTAVIRYHRREGSVDSVLGEVREVSGAEGELRPHQ